MQKRCPIRTGNESFFRAVFGATGPCPSRTAGPCFVSAQRLLGLTFSNWPLFAKPRVPNFFCARVSTAKTLEQAYRGQILAPLVAKGRAASNTMTLTGTVRLRLPEVSGQEEINGAALCWQRDTLDRSFFPNRRPMPSLRRIPEAGGSTSITSLSRSSDHVHGAASGSGVASCGYLTNTRFAGTASAVSTEPVGRPAKSVDGSAEPLRWLPGVAALGGSLSRWPFPIYRGTDQRSEQLGY